MFVKLEKAAEYYVVYTFHIEIINDKQLKKVYTEFIKRHLMVLVKRLIN